MRHTSFKLVTYALLASSIFTLYPMCTETTKTFGFPFFKQRPQILNIPRRMSGEVHHLFRPDLEYVNGSVSLAAEYTRSFKSEELGEYLFFNGTNTMRFGEAGAPGVDVARREFLLGQGFEADITTNPRVQNFIFELAFHLGLDEWVKNLYFDIQAPVAWTKWDMNFEETLIAPGGMIAQGQVGNNGGPIKAPFKNIIQAWNGQRTVAQVEDTMNFARVDGGQTELKLADMMFTVGYNFVNKKDVHFGAQIRIIAPTGTTPDAEFLFEPIAGDAHHTAVGGGIDGHFTLQRPCKTSSVSVYYFGQVFTMLSKNQARTYDLKVNGPGSRYLLIKRFDDLNLYDQAIIRGPNVLTFPSDVKIPVEAEATVLFNYKNCHWTYNIGYDVWGRSKESIDLDEGFPTEAPFFGVKGSTNTVDPGLIPPGFMGVPTANFTASRSTIKGTNDQVDIDPITGLPTAVYLINDDIDIEGAEAPAALSHKIFGYIGYEWPTCDLSPFVGLGGEVEFSGIRNTALNQWGVWVKGGFYFE